jgi:DNA-binding beta-propeller fold protein YncE
MNHSVSPSNAPDWTKVVLRHGRRWLSALVLTIAALMTVGGRTVAGASTSAIRLEVPAGLALTPAGDLLIADQRLNEVVERLPDGQMKVIAGTGHAGFSGDGGPATKAELDDPTALALAPDGTLYVVDAGNRRVRAILPDGTIVTVAGGGRLSGGSIPSGTPATEVSLDPGDIAIGPRDELYLSAGSEVLRLTSSGLLDEVAGPANFVGVVSTYAGSCGPDAIAFDRSGRLWVGCDNSRELLVRNPDGRFAVVTHLYRAHDFPGLAAAPDGSFVYVDGESIVRRSHGISGVLVGLGGFHLAIGFVPNGIAIAPDGTIYTDSRFGDGFTQGAALAEVKSDGKTKVLASWKENCRQLRC